MSYDFATLQICPHRIIDDLVVLEEPMRNSVVFPVRPVNDDVTVKIDGTVIPKMGSSGIVPVVFSKLEPYRIVKNVSDLVYLQINGAIQRIELTPGAAVSALSLGRYLQSKTNDAIFKVRNGHIVMEAVVGKSATFHDPRIEDKFATLPDTTRCLAAYSALGITPGRTSKSKAGYPGWSIEFDANLQQTSLVFNDVIPNLNPVIQLSYTTVASYCPRCEGSSYEYDYRVKDSSFETVRNSDLLAQELDKFIFTRLGSHFKWRWMGSNIMDRIGGKALGAPGVVDLDVSNAFNVYQNIKSQQASLFAGQNVTDAEFPGSIRSISSQSQPNDPTIVYTNITVSNRSLLPVQLTRLISTPDPFTALVAPDGTGPYMFRG